MKLYIDREQIEVREATHYSNGVRDKNHNIYSYYRRGKSPIEFTLSAPDKDGFYTKKQFDTDNGQLLQEVGFDARDKAHGTRTRYSNGKVCEIEEYSHGAKISTKRIHEKSGITSSYVKYSTDPDDKRGPDHVTYGRYHTVIEKHFFLRTSYKAILFLKVDTDNDGTTTTVRYSNKQPSLITQHHVTKPDQSAIRRYYRDDKDNTLETTVTEYPDRSYDTATFNEEGEQTSLFRHNTNREKHGECFDDKGRYVYENGSRISKDDRPSTLEEQVAIKAANSYKDNSLILGLAKILVETGNRVKIKQ